MSLIREIFSKIRNSWWTIINPATEEKQDIIIWYVDWIETSLALIEDNQTNSTQKTQIIDSLWNTWNLESNWAMPINIQDQTSELLDVYFWQVQWTCILSSATIIDNNQVTLQSWHWVTIWNLIAFREWIRYTQCYVNNVVWDIITLDRPMDYTYSTSAQVLRWISNMAVDWSITPQIFRVTPVWLSNIKFDITKLIFFIEDNTQMDSQKFGWIASISNWLVLRKKDWIYKNIFSVKNNWDFAHHCDVLEYDDRAWWSWVYAIRIIKNFWWQHNQWVVIRLDSNSNDELQIIIQDNLTLLSRLQCIAIWHFITN